ncbi:MAG: hypothetical protein Unbinned273contig1001_11 [Prokaryotic dsDNA virus sp.]|nr:MAG: hypothetical protein Unbinned273contig1001_11 [Prokaryotic dsDNA virus sp.]|tara:strand:+ start:1184 stop:1552 length:369 start_codon:yes stop_codon:yes gene_type:complete
MNAVRKAIATDLAQGPGWMRSFQASKAVIAAMIEDNELGRVKPPHGRGYNMIGLTPEGARKYRLTVEPCLLARSKQQLRADLAEHMSQGMTITAAARAADIPPTHATVLWAEIKAELGWQAC